MRRLEGGKKKRESSAKRGEMRIQLLSDAPLHNLALMKISTHHKRAGDEVMLRKKS